MFTSDMGPQSLQNLRIQQKSKSTLYRPTFYKLSSEKDRSEFIKLLELPGITVNDNIFDQVKELVKVRNPSIRFSTEALLIKTKEHIGKVELEAYGVWVFYPWSNRLVHILDREEFIDVRTSRNMHKITAEERDLLQQKKIGIIGLSVGQSVSATLAMERICSELRLADFDTLELTNLNRIRTGIHNLGLLKVYSVAREIAEIDPYLKVVCFPEGITEDNMDKFFTEGGNLDLLVEESDGFDIKILSRLKAKELRIPVIMEASDRCMVDVERFDLEPNRKILHGILDHLDVTKLKELTTNEQKIPYMFDILGIESTSPRLRASMLEMQQTVTTWPQLGSAVTMGGGITADVCRRMLLNLFTESGRYYVDIDELIGNKISQQLGTEEITQPEVAEISEREMLAATKFADARKSECSPADLEKIVEALRLAPSYANFQPWKILAHQQKLFLFHNPKEKLQLSDPNFDNSFISVGTAIENAKLEAEKQGYEVELILTPNAAVPQLMCAFIFAKNEKIKTDLLANFIVQRRTNRSLGSGKKIEASSLDSLKEAMAGFNGTQLNFTTDADKIALVAETIAVTERFRLLNSTGHGEYFELELKNLKNDKPCLAGLDFQTLQLPSPMKVALTAVSDPKVAEYLSQWNKGKVFENYTRQLIMSSSAIGLISVPVKQTSDLLKAGRAVERVWLSATKNNLAFQPICLSLSLLKSLGSKNLGENCISKSTFSELSAMKAQLSLVFGEVQSKNGVFLFRLTQADDPMARSLRKPLSEVYFKS